MRTLDLRRPSRAARIARAAAPALALLAAAACQRTPPAPPASPHDVQAVKVTGELPKIDPDAAAWTTAPEHVATLMLQDQTEPRLLKPSVATLRVRALQDGGWVAFRLEWDDPDASTLPHTGHGSDGVAVQIPSEAGGNVPDAAMGQPGKPVRIHLWKASLEARPKEQGDAVAALYPNASPDHYPFTQAEESQRAALEAQYAPARAAGNPFLGRPDAPVQDLLAEGFGTLSADAQQVSMGKGVYKDGKWRVTIARPMDKDATGALRPGARTYAAFAVWEGGVGNAGSRKMRTGWIPLAL